MMKSRRYLILTIAIMAFIFIQSALPSDLSGAESGFIVGFLVRVLGLPEEGLHLVIRKLAHFSEYLVLGVSLSLTVRYGTWKNAGGSKWKNRLQALTGTPGTLTFAGTVLAWGIGACYAVTDEFHQFFVAGRSCEFRDMCIDAAGVLCGCVLYTIFHLIKDRRTMI